MKVSSQNVRDAAPPIKMPPVGWYFYWWLQLTPSNPRDAGLRQGFDEHARRCRSGFAGFNACILPQVPVLSGAAGAVMPASLRQECWPVRHRIAWPILRRWRPEHT